MVLLRATVIGMAVLIVAAIAILVYGLVTRSGSVLVGPASLEPDRALVLRLGLPRETQIRSLAAGERTLAVHFDIPGQGQWIYVIPLTGDGRMLRIAVSGEDNKP